tara:strand:+ start:1877 stop:2413 length:537 start_codon:yes stop_codon:yes gene_type:complete
MSANSPDARIDFTKKDSEKIDTIHNLILAYDSESSGLREEVRLLNEFSKTNEKRIERLEDKMVSFLEAYNEETNRLHDEIDDVGGYAEKLRKDVERIVKINNLKNEVDDDAVGENKAGKKRRKKTKSKPTKKCKQYLRNKIKKTMREYKKKTKGIKNRKQALAIAYSQTKKKHPKCKF